MQKAAQLVEDEVAGGPEDLLDGNRERESQAEGHREARGTVAALVAADLAAGAADARGEILLRPALAQSQGADLVGDDPPHMDEANDLDTDNGTGTAR